MIATLAAWTAGGADDSTVPSVTVGTLLHNIDNSGRTLEELQCLRDTTKKGSPFRSRLATYNFMALAQHLHQKLSDRSAEERALFYSHTIHETQQFMQLSEVNSTTCWNNVKKHPLGELTASEACQILDDLGWRLGKLKFLDTYGGGGLLHITGCDTLFTILHGGHFNQYLAYFPTEVKQPATCPPNRCKKGQVGMECSDEIIADAKARYLKRFKSKIIAKYGSLENFKFDPHGLIDNPAILQKTWHKESPHADPIHSPHNKLIVDSSFVFWDLKCGDSVKKAVRLIRGGSVATASKKVTTCVNGGSNGLDERTKWLKRALKCTGVIQEKIPIPQTAPRDEFGNPLIN